MIERYCEPLSGPCQQAVFFGIPDADPQGVTVGDVARVVNSDNFQTSDGRNVTWDTEAPGVSLSLVSPASSSDRLITSAILGEYW